MLFYSKYVHVTHRLLLQLNAYVTSFASTKVKKKKKLFPSCQTAYWVFGKVSKQIITHKVKLSAMHVCSLHCDTSDCVVSLQNTYFKTQYPLANVDGVGCVSSNLIYHYYDTDFSV